MVRIARLCISMLYITLLASCGSLQSKKINDDNFVMDYDWQADVYNLVLVEATDSDNLRLWVRQGPSYFDGSPHQLACVEVAQPMEPARFYIANLNLYSLVEVRNCDSNFWVSTNLMDPNRSRMDVISKVRHSSNTGNNNSNAEKLVWGNIPSISAYYADRSNLRLLFGELFSVNDYQLTSEGRETLLLIIKRLLDKHVYGITIYGVADSSGDYSTNRGLADARARTVRDYLVKEGLYNVHYVLRGSVENALKTQENRKNQRRFMIEVRFM